MKHSYPFDKIIWAIDPLVQDRTPQATVAKVISALIDSTPEQIFPVAVVLEEQIPYLVGPHFTALDFKIRIEESLNRWLKEFRIPNLLPVSLLIEPQFSVRSAVLRLLRHAKENHCHLIVCTTHAKPRENLAELGTFSENLFLQSKLPCLFIHPKTHPPTQFKEILFPTDLSEMSLKALEEITPFIDQIKAHVTLFHKAISFVKESVDFPFSADARSRFLEQKTAEKTFELQEILKGLNSKGIKSDLVIDSFESEYVAKSIVARSQLIKDPLIAMAAYTHHDPATIPGSITRQILRSSLAPVLVLHPQTNREK